jgi:hypothetical protein
MDWIDLTQDRDQWRALLVISGVTAHLAVSQEELRSTKLVS